MDLILYSNPMSRGRIARWMLEEVGAPYEVNYLDYETSMKGADFLKINPMGKVPVLKHGDIVVTEAAAICCYLADAFPETNLAPALSRRGAYYRWLFYAAGPVEAAVTNKSIGMDPTDEQKRTFGYGNYADVMDTLETAVSGDGYVAGDQFTAADVYVGSTIGWGLMFGTMEKRDAFEAYWARLSGRDAYRRAGELDDAAIPSKPS